MSIFNTTRRQFLAATLPAAALAGLAPGITAAGHRGQQESQPFRLVFMPCIHLRDEHDSAGGLAAALKAVAALSPKADVIVTGGDLIQNARDLSPADAQRKADEFLAIFAEHAPAGVPIHHVIGNHDIAGWRESRDQWDQQEPLFAKGLLLRKMQMPGRNYVVEFRNWLLVMLDNVHLTNPGQYVGRFDEEALGTLREAVKAHPQSPALVFGHLPAVTATEFMGGRAKVEQNNWTVGTARMCENPMDLLAAAEGGNVRAFVSGHIHDVDDIAVAGARFICSGSVSGQQWTGPKLPRPGCEEGFGIFDCRADGTFDYAYHDYGWQAKP